MTAFCGALDVFCLFHRLHPQRKNLDSSFRNVIQKFSGKSSDTLVAVIMCINCRFLTHLLYGTQTQRSEYFHFMFVYRTTNVVSEPQIRNCAYVSILTFGFCQKQICVGLKVMWFKAALGFPHISPLQQDMSRFYL